MSHRSEKRTRRAARLFNAGLMTALSVEILSTVAPALAHAGAQPAKTADPPLRSSAKRSLARRLRPASSSQRSSSGPLMTALPSGRRDLRLAAAGPAQAAPTSPGDEAPGSAPQLQAVVVTGFRQSLESALNEKRFSQLPIEAVAPEDLGKMPDQDVAESLQRLPGVQINRAQGFGTQVLIDGLSQNLTVLNGDVFLTGREFYMSGEGSGNGAGSQVQYNSLENIPSEEISGIDVLKNPEASTVAGGIGGTIDLKTRDPLALPLGLTVGGNVRGVSSEGTGGVTPSGSLVFGYKLNQRFAVTASVSYDKENTFTKEFQDQNRATWTITNSAYTPPASGGATAADYSTLSKYYIQPQLAYFSNINDTRTVSGATLGIGWKITDAVTTRLRWFYSDESDTNITYSDKAYFNGGGVQNVAGQTSSPQIPGIDPQYPYSIDGNGVVQSGTFATNGAETATLFQGTSDHANNFQWITGFDNGGPLRGTLGVYFSRAGSNFQAAQEDIEHGLYETSAGAATAPGAPGCNNGGATCGTDPNASPGYLFAWTNGGTSGLPTISYPTNVLSNPAWTTFKSAWAWASQGAEEQKAIRLDLHWEPAGFHATTISGGARFGTRDANEIFGRYLINGTLSNGQVAGNTNCPNCGPWDYYQDPGYGTPNIPYSTAATNPGLMMTVNNFAAGPMTVKNPYSGGMTNPATFLGAVWAGAGVPNNTEQFFEDTLSSFDVYEKTISTYLMGDIGSRADRYHINFGVRVVKTDLTVNGAQTNESPTYYGTASWNGVNSNNVPVRTLRGYTDVLPSFNFTLDLTDTQLMRFSAARVTAPQDLFLLGIGNSYNFTRTTDPSRTNIYNGTHDGFEFINGNSGNPNLDPYRANQFLIAYENYFSPGAVASVEGFWKTVDSFVTTAHVPTKVPDDFGGTVGTINEPVNGSGGEIYGLELSTEYPFSGLLNGFGVDFNYTLSKSQTDVATAFTQHLGFPGVSENAFTGVVYYQRFGFSGRLSYTWRDKAVNDSLVGPTFQFQDQNANQKVYAVYQAPYGELDAQVGYDFNEHFGLVLSATNLTDSALHTYLQWPDLPFTYDDWGRRYFFGFRFKN
jgi:iron complex outermembrane receptor protein